MNASDLYFIAVLFQPNTIMLCYRVQQKRLYVSFEGNILTLRLFIKDCFLSVSDFYLFAVLSQPNAIISRCLLQQEKLYVSFKGIDIRLRDPTGIVNYPLRSPIWFIVSNPLPKEITV